MKRYDGYYLFSDMDGTLLTGAYEIPPNNLDALRRFTEGGGRFALATGRGVAGTLKYYRQTCVNLPCALLNGAMIYDFSREESSSTAQLPNHAWALVDAIGASYPEMRVFLWGDTGRYDVCAPGCMPADGNILSATKKPTKLYKIVIEVPDGQRLFFTAWLQSLSLIREMTVVPSSDWFVEVMPQGITKGTAVERIIERMKLPRDRVLVIGDYLNDLEMLTLPGVRSFCPANAHDDIKAACQQVLCHVDGGAVANLIDQL